MPLEHGKGDLLRAAGQEKPVAGQPGVIYRWVAPALGRLRAGCPTGFHVGAVGIGQTVTFRVALAGADHAIERGQKLGLFNDFAGAATEGLGLELGETLQPELFDLVEHLGIAVGLVVLVVVVDAKQRESLVQSIDMGIGGRPSPPLTGPSFGR